MKEECPLEFILLILIVITIVSFAMLTTLAEPPQEECNSWFCSDDYSLNEKIFTYKDTCYNMNDCFNRYELFLNNLMEVTKENKKAYGIISNMDCVCLSYCMKDIDKIYCEEVIE